MKKRNRVIATLITLCVLVAAIGPVNLFDTTDTAEAAYTMNKTYDATEEYFKLQTSPYSYNGYKMNPFTTCNDWLSARPDGGTKIGEGMSVVTGGNVKQGDKLVIEFQEPINSKEFEVITLTMKQVPGNSYNAYNSTDNILSTVRKSFSFSTYELEKVSFQTALFADSNGYVNAIILHNTISEFLQSKQIVKQELIREEMESEMDMCKALEDLYQDGVDVGKGEKLREQVEKKLQKGFTVPEIADMLEESEEVILTIVKKVVNE